VTGEDAPRRYFRQLLAGSDFARDDPVARQMANYVYALGDRSSGEAVLVDPAYDPEELVALLEEDSMALVGAVVTHYHADHAGGALGPTAIRGVAELLEARDVPVYAQASEVAWLARSTGLPERAFRPCEPGEVLRVGALAVTLVHTPGHTPGSQCLLVGDLLCTGDTLFLSGCGRTDLPGGDPDELYESLTRRLAPLPDGTRVFPGHAYDAAPSGRLGTLRRENPVLAPLDRHAWRAAFAPERTGRG
jgi:hydroxyacylglutathione hydrolase